MAHDDQRIVLLQALQGPQVDHPSPNLRTSRVRGAGAGPPPARELHERVTHPVVSRAERRIAGDARTRAREIQIDGGRKAPLRLVDAQDDEIVSGRGARGAECLVETATVGGVSGTVIAS